MFLWLLVAALCAGVSGQDYSGGNCSSPNFYRQWAQVNQPCGGPFSCVNSFYHGIWSVWSDSNGTICQKDPTSQTSNKTICVQDNSLANGARCIDWAVCKSGYCKKPAGAMTANTTVYGNCTAQAPVLEKCNDTNLPNKRACFGLNGCALDGICHVLAGIGDACDMSWSDSGNIIRANDVLCPGFCENKKCRLAKAGERCLDGFQCDSGFCNATSSKCGPKNTWGATCKTDSDCYGMGGWVNYLVTCGSGGKCVPSFTVPAGKQAVKPRECMWGTFLNSTGYCTKTLSCQKDTDCWPNNSDKSKRTAFTGVSCDCTNGNMCTWNIKATSRCTDTAARIATIPRTPAAQANAFRSGRDFDENFRRFGDFAICQCSTGSKWLTTPPVCQGVKDCGNVLDSDKQVCPDGTGYRMAQANCTAAGCCWSVTASGPWCYKAPAPSSTGTGSQRCDAAAAQKCVLKNLMSVFLPKCQHSKKIAECYSKANCIQNLLDLCGAMGPCAQQMPEFC